MTVVLPESITAGVTTGHNAHHVELHKRQNASRNFPPIKYGSVGDGVADDTLAIQDAVAACSAAGGGTVGPLARHRMTAELSLPINVELYGSHMGYSWLDWQVDLGVGKYGIKDVLPTAGTGPFAPVIRDLSLYGPGGNTLGVRGCQMNGIRAGQQARFHNVGVFEFGAGIVSIWDHQLFDHIDVRDNFYGVLFDSIHDGASQIGTAGNHTFLHSIFVGNKFSGVAIHVNNVIDTAIFLGCHFGFGGHGIYRGNMGATSTNLFAGMISAVFETCSFEYIGNSIYRDASTGTSGTGTQSMLNSRFIGNSYTTSDAAAYRITTEPFDYTFDLLRAGPDIDWWQGSQSLGVPQGGKGILRAGVMDKSVRLHMLPPTPAGTVGHSSYGMNFDWGDTAGTCRQASGTITAGDLLAWTGANSVGRMTAATVGAWAGVAWNDATTAVDQNVVVVIPPGSVAMLNSDAVTGFGTKLYPKAGTEHIASGTVNGQALARIHSPGGGGSQVEARLMGV